MVLSFVLALVLIQTLSTGSSPTWYEHYERGIRLIEEGNAGEAQQQIRRAVAMRSAEGLQVPTRALQYLDYLPHLYLAIAAQMLGDVDEARKQLAAAEKSGLASRSEVGRPLLIAYQQLLRGNVTRYERPRYAVFPERQPVLSEAEFDMLKQSVLSHCNVPPNSLLADVPWYAHYELGLEVERKGDPQRAVNLFIEAVNRRPDPQRKARMYGMWLIDYYPYFHIARSHMRLGNYECAKDALEISSKLREITPASREYLEFLALKEEAQRRSVSPQ